jgi:chitin synthase
MKVTFLFFFRLDSDQCARRTARNYLHLKDLDYYEYEGHIFFDDGMEEDENNEQVPNKFVQQLLGVVDRAATYISFFLFFFSKHIFL